MNLSDGLGLNLSDGLGVEDLQSVYNRSPLELHRLRFFKNLKESDRINESYYRTHLILGF